MLFRSISYAIDEMKERNGERWTVKQMESQKKKLEEQLKSLSDESRKDDLITFEELGVDSIMVDEAHNFKNLAIFSKMNNVSGISLSLIHISDYIMENNVESRNLFLFLSNDEGDNYFCRSFFPEEKMDYSKNQASWTCLLYTSRCV